MENIHPFVVRKQTLRYVGQKECSLPEEGQRMADVLKEKIKSGTFTARDMPLFIDTLEYLASNYKPLWAHNEEGPNVVFRLIVPEVAQASFQIEGGVLSIYRGGDDYWNAPREDTPVVTIEMTAEHAHDLFTDPVNSPEIGYLKISMDKSDKSDILECRSKFSHLRGIIILALEALGFEWD